MTHAPGRVCGKAQGGAEVDGAVTVVLALMGSLFRLGLVLLRTAVAASVVRLVLASFLTVLALLDRAALWIDVLQWTI